MSLGLKPYPEMKDSHVEWLGPVPAHWEVTKLGRIGRFFKGNGASKDDEVPTGVPCIRYGDLYTKHTYFIHDSRACITEERANAYTPIEPGDVLFAGSGETIDEIGKSAVNLIEGEAYCGGDIIVFRPKRRVNPRYMGYATDFRTAAIEKARMGRGFTIVHIYGDQLKGLTIPLPPVPEQSAIARFLEHADRRIRRYVRAKQKLIALLEEQKQAIIHESVTSQLDVRTGRPYPSYTDTGRAWPRRIPMHWELQRSKRVFRPSRELARPNDIQLSATQAYGVIAQEDYENKVGRKVVRIERHLEQRRHVEIDDFVISMRSFQGGLERAWVSGCIRSSYIVLRPVTKLEPGYFGHLFKSVGYIGALQSTADFIRDGQDLNFRNFCEVDLPFPPIREQKQIAQALDDISNNVAFAIERMRNQVEVLFEYHRRLVADAVTGKLDVRDAAMLQILDNEENEEVPNEVTTDVTTSKAGEVGAVPAESEA